MLPMSLKSHKQLVDRIKGINSQSACFRLARRSHICDITSMARGPSKRIVVEVDDPELKRDLHAALAADDVTMKEWFQEYASKYLATRTQPPLPGLAIGNDALPHKPRKSHAV